MTTERSHQLYTRAIDVIPGGVNSPVRAFKAVGGNPRFIAKGEGAYLFDVDGNRYIDCIGSWGPLIYGHAHPRVQAVLRNQIELGTTFGAPTELEVEMAEAICRAVPSIEKVRLVSSGTEATMSAIRAARGYTGRTKALKFEGCYHGHADSLLAKSGSGVATFGLPDSAGVPPNLTADTITLPYNDIDAVKKLFAAQGAEIACIIIEPVVGNMGCVPPSPGYLQGLRDIATLHNTVLIFDEVMTGFRLARGGAQELFGIQADLTTLGKVIGGGLPVGAYGGKREIMNCVAPIGPVYQAGTLSGNPLAVGAGLESLRMIEEDPGLYARLNAKGARIAQGLRDAAKTVGVPVTVNQVGSMFTLFFTDQPVFDYTSAKASDTNQFAVYFSHMLNAGIYLPPSQFEAAFLSDAISEADIDSLLASAKAALQKVSAS